MKQIAKLSFIAILFVACVPADKQDTVTSYKYSEQDILGTWSSLSLTVTYLDIDSVFVVPEGEWETSLNIKPIKTTYASDSTYISEYFDLNGSLVFSSSGTWFLRSDSLFLEANGTVTPYKFSLEENVGRFEAILDWDQDGNARERYDGRQERL